jgi:autotransporter-associated beta strand protein
LTVFSEAVLMGFESGSPMRVFNPLSSSLRQGSGLAGHLISRSAFPFRLLTSVLCLLTSAFAPSASAYESQNSAIWESSIAERAFDSGPSWFSAGPAWLMNAMPGSNFRAHNYVIDSAGDRQESTTQYNGYVGTLRDVFDVGLFNNIATFVGSSSPKTSGSSVSAVGTSYSYIGGTGGLWSVSTNWTPNGVPNGPADSAVNTQTSNASVSQDVVPGVTVGKISHDSTANVSWTITATNPITLNNTGASPSASPLIRNADANTGTSNFLSIGGAGGLVFAGTLNITNSGGSTASGGSIQLSTPISGIGPVSGAGAVFFNNTSNNTSAGQIALLVANTFTGNSTIESGAVTFNNNTPFGLASNQVALGLFASLNSVSLVSAVSGVMLANTVVVAQTGDINIAPRTQTLGGITAGQTNYTGPIILNTQNNNNVILTSASTVSGGAAQTVAFTNTIQGTGGVNITGTSASVGFTSFSGANTYQGGTNVMSGTLLVNNTTSSGTGTGPVTVNNSGTLGGTGFMGTNVINVTINGGGTITGGTNGAVAPTDAVGTLTLTAASVIFTGTSGSLATYIVDLTSLTSDKLTINGSINLSTTFDQILFNGTTGADKYVLITYTGTRTGTFDVVTPPAGYVVSYDIPGEIDLIMTSIPEPATWIGGALALGAIGFTQRKRLQTVKRRKA